MASTKVTKKTSKKTSKKTAKKSATKKAAPALSNPQSKLLKTISANKGFAAVTDHHKTQQALIDRDLATADVSGTKIKPTAAGRKLAKKLA